MDWTAKPGTRWRHRKGGDYTVVAVGHIEADLTPCVVYQADGAEAVWVRPSAEFLDGRFKMLSDTKERD